MSEQTQDQPDVINNYIFRVGKCSLSSKARDKETALMYLERMWPNTKIEFEREEFSHIVQPSTSGQKRIMPSRERVVEREKPYRKPAENLSLEERMERSLAETFGGVA